MAATERDPFEPQLGGPTAGDGLKRRAEVIEALHRRWGRGGSRAARLRYWRKKYTWLAVVGSARALKRILDVVGALVGMLLLSPVFLAAALAVKFSDGGPVLFRQTRVGLHGRPFSFPKFRSMIVDAEAGWDGLAEQNQHADARSFKMKRDPRVTAVGAVLRRLSIDETPQLWCVLKGDMSLVGPRPPMPRETARYTLEDRRRLDVKPGLTGLWQVSGRGDVAFPEQLRLDVQYIHSQSLRMDLALLLKTIPAVLLGRGAY